MQTKIVTLLLMLLTFFTILATETTVPLHHYTADCYDSTRGLPQNSIRTIVRDETGYIYLGTQEGLVIFNGATMQIINHHTDSELLSDDIRTLTLTKSGKLLVGTTRGIYTLKDRKIVPESGEMQEFFITAITQSPDGSLWIGTDTHGIFHRTKNGSLQSYTTTKNNIHSDHITSIFITEKGNIYCGTNEGVEYFDNAQFHKVGKTSLQCMLL